MSAEMLGKERKRTLEPVQKKPIEYLLEFIVNISRQMIVSGANLERVELAIGRICDGYGLKDVGVFLLNTHMSVSAAWPDGVYATRQISIPAAGINLDQLKKLNRLSYKVAAEHPEPELLPGMLQEVMEFKDYPDLVVLLGQCLGMVCLALILGGTIMDAVAVVPVTIILHYMQIMFSSPSIDRIVANAFCMFAATTAAIFLVHFGLGDHTGTVVITVSLLVLPGIPLVNAMRNLFCNNEINGILQLLKVALETLSLAIGTYISFTIFGRWIVW